MTLCFKFGDLGQHGAVLAGHRGWDMRLAHFWLGCRKKLPTRAGAAHVHHHGFIPFGGMKLRQFHWQTSCKAVTRRRISAAE